MTIMESSDTTTTTSSTSNTTITSTGIKQFSSSTSTSPTFPTTVISPCAACKMLRRRCVDKCVLAPYFPPTEPLKFTIAHRVFGASNIIKSLQELPESQRADTVSSMVYEANARIRDPVYGSAGVICQLQMQVTELQAQLARAQAEIVNMKAQYDHLFAVIYMGIEQRQQECNNTSNTVDDFTANAYIFHHNDALLFDESYQFSSSWDEEEEEQLWI